MGILNNTPTLSYLYFKDLIITYENESYQIQNSYTYKSYIYWDYNNPYTLIFSNEVLSEMAGRFYICYNDRGNYTLVPQTEISINFSEGVSKDLVTEKIFGIKEELKDNGEKFVTIEQDIDGIKQTVGTVQESVNGNSQKITELEQTSERIEFNVSEIEREFNEDLEAKTLRDNISISILNLQSILGSFSSDMNSFMENNTLSDAENEEISIYKNNVSDGKLELNSQIDILITALSSNGQTDKANTLTSQKELLNTSITNLINTIDNSCADEIFTNSEITAIVSRFGNVNSKINETKNLIDEYIFLGVGGELIEKIANLTIKQDEIKLSVSKTESVLKNSLNLSKSLVQGIIDSNNTALINFKKCFSVIVEDRELTETEIDSLNVRIEGMDNEIDNILNKKNELAEDDMLDETERNNLTLQYENFINSYDILKEKINEVIEDNIVNDVELLEINEKVNDYYNQLNNIHSCFCQCLDNIDTNTINKAINDAKDELIVEINELDDKVNTLESDVTTSISSGLIDKQEKDNILQNLEILRREKVDIDNRFNEWYNSEFLYGDLKKTYKQTYDEYIEKYNSLTTLSETIANKEDLVTENERLSIQIATNEFLESLDIFFKESEMVVRVISSNEINYVKSNLSKDFCDVNNKLNDLSNEMNESFKDGIITEIELKNIENILIQMDKEKLDIDEKYEELYNNDNLNG